MGGLPTLGTAIVSGIGAGKQRKHDANEAKAKREADNAEAKAQREHQDAVRRRQVAADLLPQRQARIDAWRENLRVARNEVQSWQLELMHVEGEDEPRHRLREEQPNVVGEEWFEELRAHLPDDSMYRRAQSVFCDLETVTALALEVGRIERAWTAEAQG